MSQPPHCDPIIADYRALIEASGDGVFHLDEGGRWLALSAAWGERLGGAHATCLGKPAWRLVEASDRAEALRAWRALRDGETPIRSLELNCRAASGGVCRMRVHARALRGQRGEWRGVLGRLSEISTAQVAGGPPGPPVAPPEQSYDTKSDFLALMSHELRTPLNAVIGLSESLLEEGAPFESTRTTRYLGIMHQSGRQLLAKINAMIDLGRMDAGRIKPTFALLDVGAFCASVVEVVQRDFQVKAVSLALVRPELPVQVPADEKLLRQLLQNLLSNALKFTPQHGTVSVLVSSRPEGGAAISVEDSGVGMAEGKRAQIFRPFTQGDGSLSRQIGGTGLGLTLVARIARLHGATVAVRSQPGRGSTFTLELRAEPGLATPTQ